MNSTPSPSQQFTPTAFGYTSDRYRRLDQIQNAISLICGIVAAASIFAIIVLTLLEVVMRTVFAAPQGWTTGLIEEALMVAAAFFGIVTAYRCGAHVAIVSFFNKMRAPIRKVVLLISYFIVIACFVLLATSGWRAMVFAFGMGYIVPPGMAELSVPIWIWMVSVPVASALGAIVVSLDIWKELASSWSSPTTDYPTNDMDSVGPTEQPNVDSGDKQ